MKTKVLLALMPPILILWLPRAEAVINNSKKKPGDLGDLELSKVDKPGKDSVRKELPIISKSDRPTPHALSTDGAICWPPAQKGCQDFLCM